MSAQVKARDLLFPLGISQKNADSIELIPFIVKDFLPKRRGVASRQLTIYCKKLLSHPSMRSFYLEKIKQLIHLEKEMVNKNE